MRELSNVVTTVSQLALLALLAIALASPHLAFSAGMQSSYVGLLPSKAHIL